MMIETIGSVDLLLLDLNMPIQNGHDILKELSTYPHIEDLCVVMFSTSRRAIDKEIAERLGASFNNLRKMPYSCLGFYYHRWIRLLCAANKDIFMHVITADIPKQNCFLDEKLFLWAVVAIRNSNLYHRR